MSIKKRTLPKKPKRKKRVLSPHQKRCKRLYNRLQEDDSNDGVRYVLNQLTPFEMNTHLALQYLITRADTTVSTLQVNGPYGKGATFRVHMAYTDRTKKPHLGYLYPQKAVVKTSPILLISVMLSYIELSKNVGRFI
jgi:hypothetical protein